MKTDYDVITVGGGLGASALAKVLAENGKRVLVVERETMFKDRIRGEWMAPWGVEELEKLGLYQWLCLRCANDQPFIEIIGMGPPRDLRATSVPGRPA
jgi:menaquinone-9 beta-reductase